MIEEVTQNRFVTASDLFKNKIINHNDVSLSTINRLLIEEGFHAFSSPVRPYISPKAAKQRLQWAKDVK
jgi:hypothetical protein